jgi:hypothetical protein
MELSAATSGIAWRGPGLSAATATFAVLRRHGPAHAWGVARKSQGPKVVHRAARVASPGSRSRMAPYSGHRPTRTICGGVPLAAGEPLSTNPLLAGDRHRCRLARRFHPRQPPRRSDSHPGTPRSPSAPSGPDRYTPLRSLIRHIRAHVGVGFKEQIVFSLPWHFRRGHDHFSHDPAS